MAIVRVHGNDRAETAAANHIDLTLANTPTNGNLLVATIGIMMASDTAPTVTSITETNVTWTVQKAEPNGAFGQINQEIWVGVVGASPSASLTVNFSGTADAAVVDVCEYSGLLTVGFLDKTASANDGGAAGTSTLTGTTAVTSQADELWVGGVVTRYQSQSTPKNAFTLLDGALDVTENVAEAYLEKIVSATAAASSGTTASGASFYGGCIITLKAPSAPPAGAVAVHHFYPITRHMNQRTGRRRAWQYR